MRRGGFVAAVTATVASPTALPASDGGSSKIAVLPRLAGELVAWKPDIFAIIGAVECKAQPEMRRASPVSIRNSRASNRLFDD